MQPALPEVAPTLALPFHSNSIFSKWNRPTALAPMISLSTNSSFLLIRSTDARPFTAIQVATLLILTHLLHIYKKKNPHLIGHPLESCLLHNLTLSRNSSNFISEALKLDPNKITVADIHRLPQRPKIINGQKVIRPSIVELVHSKHKSLI